LKKTDLRGKSWAHFMNEIRWPIGTREKAVDSPAQVPLKSR